LSFLKIVKSLELNFKSFGHGDPIIILHGLFGSLDNWQSFAKGLASDYMVYTVDQRDHGKSPHTDEFNYHLLAEDLHMFMEKNWIFSSHIIGHSMGGKVAMQFAANYPDMVEKMVIVDIAPKKYLPGHDEIFKALFSLDLGTIKDRRQADAFLADKVVDLGIRAFLLKNLKRDKEGRFHWKMNLDLLSKNYENIISSLEASDKIEVPTLFVGGEHSSYIQEEDKKLINEIFLNPTFAEVKDAGHWVHADKPEDLMKLLVDFIS